MSRRLALSALVCVFACGGCNTSDPFWDRAPRVAGERRFVPRRQAPPPAARRRSPPPATPYAAPREVAPTPAPTSPQRMASGAPTGEDFDVLARVNAIRAARGLHALAWNDTIWRAALEHSREQHHHGFMGHGSPDPRRNRLSQRMALAGYRGRMFGEVVAWNYRDAPSVVRGWMESPSHRDILLDRKMTEAAFCRVGEYWTGNFGLPFAAHAAVPYEPAPCAPPPRRPATAPSRTRSSLPTPRLPPPPPLPRFPLRIGSADANGEAERTGSRTVRVLPDSSQSQARTVRVAAGGSSYAAAAPLPSALPLPVPLPRAAEPQVVARPLPKPAPIPQAVAPLAPAPTPQPSRSLG